MQSTLFHRLFKILLNISLIFFNINPIVRAAISGKNLKHIVVFFPEIMKMTMGPRLTVALNIILPRKVVTSSGWRDCSLLSNSVNLDGRMLGFNNGSAGRRARPTKWTGVDAEVAAGLESDDEAFLYVGRYSDEDAGEGPDTPALKCQRISDSLVASSSSSLESPPGAVGAVVRSSQAHTMKKSPKNLLPGLSVPKNHFFAFQVADMTDLRYQHHRAPGKEIDTFLLGDFQGFTERLVFWRMCEWKKRKSNNSVFGQDIWGDMLCYQVIDSTRMKRLQKRARGVKCQKNKQRKNTIRIMCVWCICTIYAWYSQK